MNKKISENRISGSRSVDNKGKDQDRVFRARYGRIR